MSSKEQPHKNDKTSLKQPSLKPPANELKPVAQQQTHIATIIQRATMDPQSLTPDDLQQLHRTIGHQAVSRLFAQDSLPSKAMVAPTAAFGNNPPTTVAQRQPDEDEDLLQGKMAFVQRQEELQGSLLNYGSINHRVGTDVIQLKRALREDEKEKLYELVKILEYFYEVRTHSRSVPLRLPPDFYSRVDERYDQIVGMLEHKNVEDDFDVNEVVEQVRQLDVAMNQAKGLATGDRAATERGIDRPPSRRTQYHPENAKTEAMETAERTNQELEALTNFEKNLRILRSKPGTYFYVYGQSAMGQGDTAFIVRTVAMLKSLGLKAMGVKKQNAAHDVSTSFDTSATFITPKVMFQHAKPGDFMIEGPLSDPIPAKEGSHNTLLESLEEHFKTNAEQIFNLRLYEYGTLTYRGGQEVQQPRKSNVIHHAGDPKHAFMGMGHGEMGAFYNANETRKQIPLETALESAKGNKTALEIQKILETTPDANIYIGYANSSEVAIQWASAVEKSVGESGGFNIIIGVFGGRRFKDTRFEINKSTGLKFLFEEKKGFRAEKDKEIEPRTKPNCSMIITNNIPSQVMNALQQRAMPFTLSTGNYSLSEAIENGQLPIYETLDFNAGVQEALVWQIENATKKLALPPYLVEAVKTLIKASPESLSKLTREIKIVVEHPQEIRLITQVIKANTDIKEALVARLAFQMSGGRM